MPKQQITSKKIRQPSGHFSHATMVEARGRIVFISGMTSRRADGTIAGIGDIEAQTRQVCENLKAAGRGGGGSRWGQNPPPPPPRPTRRKLHTPPNKKRSLCFSPCRTSQLNSC